MKIRFFVIVFSLLLLVPVGTFDAFALLCPQINGCVTGNIYVVEGVGDRVSKYDSAGGFIKTNFITTGFLAFPFGIAFDSAGNIYVVNNNLGTVSKHNSEGGLLNANFITGLTSPNSIAFDSAGNIYVVAGGQVSKYDSAGGLLNANFITGLVTPIGIAFDSAENIYVVENSANTVSKYDNAGGVINANFITTGLDGPSIIAFDSAGNIYVTNSFSVSTVSKYNSEGGLLNANFITTGLVTPIGIAFDTAGNIYVANFNANTVSKYDSAGGVINANFITGVINPNSIAFDILPDNDNDGFGIDGGDCNDSDDTIFPGAPEIPGDAIDQDCDGSDVPLTCGSGTILQGLMCVIDTIIATITLAGNVIITGSLQVVGDITGQTVDDFETRVGSLETLFLNPGSNCSGTAACIPGYVTAHIDGDTLKVYGKSIRFALVDAPESGEMGFAEASDFIANACPIGALAVVDEDDMQTGGSFGRIIGVVHCNGANLNEAILDAGLATLATGFCGSSEFGTSTWAQTHGCP